MLGQCGALSHLVLSCNGIGDSGAESIAGVLVQCPSLAYLCLYGNQIGDAGAQSFAGVLAQCPALAHLDFTDNDIKADAGKRLRASWRGQAVSVMPVPGFFVGGLLL